MPKKLIEYNTTVLTPTPPLTEGVSTVGWTAPIWTLDKINLNGRVYSTELAKRICAEDRSTLVYDSHEHGMESAYDDAVAVAKSPRIEGNQLVVDIAIIDEKYGKKLQSINDAGVPIGVSSVGWGEVDNDGVVDSRTYVLERYLDFVIHPANQSYAEPDPPTPDEPDDPMGESDKASMDARKAKVESYMRIEKYKN